MTWQEWDKIAINFEGRKAKIFCNDGTCYEGIGDIYCEEENSKGENVLAVCMITNDNVNMCFLQEAVEKIEFLDNE